MFVYSILDRDLTFEEINLIPLQIFKANDHLLLFFENCLNMKRMSFMFKQHWEEHIRIQHPVKQRWTILQK